MAGQVPKRPSTSDFFTPAAMVPTTGLPRSLPVPRPAVTRPVVPDLRKPAPAPARPSSVSIRNMDQQVASSAATLASGRQPPAARAFVDLSAIPAGPGADDVDFGANCGSCSKYLASDDSRRHDPDFMESYLAGNSVCPVAIPELVKTKTTTHDYAVRADSKACAKFQFASFQASANFTSALTHLKLLTRGELDVVALMLNSLLKLKDKESDFGYKINQVVPVTLNGEALKGRVLGFKGRFLVVGVRYAGRNRTVRVLPPAKTVN